MVVDSFRRRSCRETDVRAMLHAMAEESRGRRVSSSMSLVDVVLFETKHLRVHELYSAARSFTQPKLLCEGFFQAETVIAPLIDPLSRRLG